LLDAVRLAPGADVVAVTTAQIGEVIDRLIAAGQWQHGDPEILVVLDAGYDAPRIAHLWVSCRCRFSAGCTPTASCAGRSHR
jgi:DDE superfamily endonuclease